MVKVRALSHGITDPQKHRPLSFVCGNGSVEKVFFFASCKSTLECIGIQMRDCEMQEEGIVGRLVKMILSTKKNGKTEKDDLWLKKAAPSASSARYLAIIDRCQQQQTEMS